MNRIEKSRAIADGGLCKVVSWRGWQATAIIVPGSEGKQYEVILHRVNKSIKPECHLITSNGPAKCKGNLQTPCYHSLAAILVAAKERDNEVAICKRPEDAKLRARIGGKVFKISPWNAGKNVRPLFLVVNNKKWDQERKAEKRESQTRSAEQAIKEMGF